VRIGKKPTFDSDNNITINIPGLHQQYFGRPGRNDTDGRRRGPRVGPRTQLLLPRDEDLSPPAPAGKLRQLHHNLHEQRRDENDNIDQDSIIRSQKEIWYRNLVGVFQNE
jgi:hypothetical protein